MVLGVVGHAADCLCAAVPKAIFDLGIVAVGAYVGFHGLRLTEWRIMEVFGGMYVSGLGAVLLAFHGWPDLGLYVSPVPLILFMFLVRGGRERRRLGLLVWCQEVEDPMNPDQIQVRHWFHQSRVLETRPRVRKPGD